jgi:penicillin-binding protein 1C
MRLGWWIAFAVLVLAPAVLFWPMDADRYLAVEASGEIQDRNNQTLMAFLNDSEQWCFPRTLNDVSPYLIQATIAAEDQRFRKHPGVDAAAVMRAGFQNMKGRGIVSGASTLTMQVVKRQHPSRSVAGKALQAIQALRLDARVSKDKILECYLNSAPYGLNLVGCEAASRRYFGVPASELTIAEAALLAGLPKSPSGSMPLTKPEEARQRRDYVLRRMLQDGYISAEEFDTAHNSPIDVAWHEFPKRAPHLAMRLSATNPPGSSITTTIDARIQTKVEELVKDHLRRHSDEITNAAAMVVDVETAEILAYVGSGDFFNTPGGGQVDACRALRSPGSALKPFIYGWAIENNQLYPCETLYDGTIDYGQYNPANYDGNFNGLVSASEALRYSLNIPVITVLDRIGVPNICAFLPKIGINTIVRPPDSYGLGLAVGNCEVRLADVAAAYCALANLGEYRSLRILASGSESKPARRFSPGTCLSLFSMLEQPLPEEFDSGLVPVGHLQTRVCWKTGTSAGNRDAWSFVFNRHYVVGVWMGNNDGTFSRRLVGADVALPLASEVFRMLPPKSTPAWPEDHGESKWVPVCATSGLPATEWCRYTRLAAVPREQFLLRTCDVHHPSIGGNDTQRRIVERWPGSAIKWDLASVDIGSTSRPRVAGVKERRDELRILTPANESVYVLSGETNGDRIKLQASIERKTALHWYLDHHYLGESVPEQSILLKLEPGIHRITCMDPTGALDSVVVQVVRPETVDSVGSTT